MTERLLQYIWQFQYYNRNELLTEEKDILQILHPGTFNTNQGPDFINAKIKTGNTTWAGSIELHLLSSDWKNHKHSGDKNYRNVILHVVWQHDTHQELSFPTLVLQHRVSKFFLKKYDELMNAVSFIPCENQLANVSDITWTSWKERLMIERLETRSLSIFSSLEENNFHWEETFWWLLAKNFGVKINSDAFEKIARSIPLKILSKHKHQIHQVEALLFGQAGLLHENFTEEYPALLAREYRFLKNKYELSEVHTPLYFLRMRPANFPSLRLAQLAMLIHTSVHLFVKIKETIFLRELKALLSVTANDYWHYHYVFDEAAGYKKKTLGKQMIDNICINTVIPVLFAYGLYHREQSYKDKALQWLMEISAEKNEVTKGFIAHHIINENAFDSQALLQLKNEYCNNKRCLECAIGNSLLKKQG